MELHAVFMNSTGDQETLGILDSAVYEAMDEVYKLLSLLEARKVRQQAGLWELLTLVVLEPRRSSDML